MVHTWLPRSSPGGRSGNSRSTSTPDYTSTVSNSTDTDVVCVTRSDGTVVEPHTRSKPSSTEIKINESAGSLRVYVDNAYNRKLGHVGKPSPVIRYTNMQF